MFGANLLASLEEEHWSDGEQMRGRPIKPASCSVIVLSLICVLAVGCLLSPLCMLILPLVLPFDHGMYNPFTSTSRETFSRTCDVKCEANLLSISVKILLLCFTTCRLYAQPVFTVCHRLRIRPLSVSALLHRKLRAPSCYGLDYSPLDPATLHPFPFNESLIGLTLSVNLLGLGATCAFWVAFAARWLKGLLESKTSETLSAVSEDLHVQFGIPPSAAAAGVVAGTGQGGLVPGSYANLVNFVLTFTDTLLLLHLVGITLRALHWLRGGRRHYVIQVVRSPDGVSRTYRVTGSSLEVVATQIIQNYNFDFPVSLYTLYLFEPIIILFADLMQHFYCYTSKGCIFYLYRDARVQLYPCTQFY